MYNIVKLRNTKQFVSWKFWTIGGRGVEIFYERKMTLKANTKNKKNNTIKKIVPAAGMLALSASMLATSTYAWFTMSREVEVKNIQMTATTPEDIQISLGTITSHTEAVSLAKNTGYLTDTDGAIAPTSDYDWSNTADISHYYQFGKLIPASSNNGNNIFFTPDASGVGRTMKDGATFYQAASGLTAYGTGTAAAVSSNDDASTKAHIVTGNSDTWASATYSESTAWNVTNDDGYYVDIPIWLRTTSLNDQTIYVTGYVTDKTAETNDNADADDLYKAVRVAVLGGETDATAGITTGSGTGLVVLKDCGAFADLSTATYYANKPNMTSEFGILDSDNYSGTGTSNKSGTNAVGRMSSPDGEIYGISAVAPTYTKITYNDGSSAVVTIPGATDSSAPGTAKKLIIRVWLEGEDGNCWNENANQDWNISLKFTKDPLAENPNP